LSQISSGRIQAFYLAEAGLDAACDLLNQSWVSQELFSSSLRQQFIVPVDEKPKHIGEFEVTANSIGPGLLQLRSTGRSLPVTEDELTRYGISRTLVATVMSTQKVSFVRKERPGELELECYYFDDDPYPDLIVATGDMIRLHPDIDGSGTLSAGSPESQALGYHLLASFSDADGDGDLDLILSDALSREQKAASSVISALALPEDAKAMRPFTTTSVDLFGIGKATPFIAPGWVFTSELTDGYAPSLRPLTDTLMNEPAYAGAKVISWHEEQ
jgi:hypothetical protein